MAIKYIDDPQLEIKDKRFLVRFDLNVPLKNGKITDATRIDLALPTLQYLLEKGAGKIVLMSHLGRPTGKPDAKYCLAPVASYLAEKLNQDIILTESPIDSGITSLLKLREAKILLLENLRFHKGEEANDLEFAKKLSCYGEYFVNDAFGACHRKHASIYAIHHFFKNKAYGGFLLRQEVEALQRVTVSPERPFVAIVGGVKVSDKIKTIERLLVAVDRLLIGGAMAYPFLKASGYSVGSSLCSTEDLELAKKILKSKSGHKLLFPGDHIVATGMEGAAENCSTADIPDGKMGLDIGPKTMKLFAEQLQGVKTVVWNGPMGLFENKNFAEGTMHMARAVSQCGGYTFVGGGDSVSAVNMAQVAPLISHVSSGGGASLEYIEKGELPGIQALKFGVS